MAIGTPKADAAVRKNGGICILNAGATEGVVTSAPGAEILISRSGGGAVVPSATDTSGTAKALADGTFAYQAKDDFIIRRVSETINGSANDVLKSGCSNFGRRSIHSATKRRTLVITSWSYITGKVTASSVTLTDFGADNAATPTKAIPGEFVFLETGLLPVQKDYDAKTS